MDYRYAKEEINDRKKIVVIAGPTAVGKTELAIRVAQDFNGEIVSADSMQIYKYMSIGSAKPTEEERLAAKHFLIDEIDPADRFSVSDYRKLAIKYVSDILERGKLPVISGGTGLYVNSLIYEMDFSASPENEKRRKELQELLADRGTLYIHSILEKIDPEAAKRIHPNNTRKVIRAIEAAEAGHRIPAFENAQKESSDYESLLIGLDRDREELYKRINLRVDLMMEAGLVEEIHMLMSRGLTEENISMKGIGYKEMIAYMNGEYDMETAIELVKRNSRRYAKRQLTWFRRYPQMHWFNLSRGVNTEYENIKYLISDYLKGGPTNE